MGVDGSGGRGILESTVTIFYNLLHTDWALQNGFDFFAENNEQIYKMVCSFFYVNP